MYTWFVLMFWSSILFYLTKGVAALAYMFGGVWICYLVMFILTKGVAAIAYIFGGVWLWFLVMFENYGNP